MRNLSYENEFYSQVHSNANHTHFHMKDFALGLGLKQRQKATRKWPIRKLSQGHQKPSTQNKYYKIAARGPFVTHTDWEIRKLDNDNTCQIIAKYTYLMFQKRKEILNSNVINS